MPTAARVLPYVSLSRRLALAAAACLPLAGAMSTFPVHAQTPLTVQVINDSGQPDFNVFLLLGGQSVTLGNGTVLQFAASDVVTVDTGSASPNATGGALGCPTGAPASCKSLLARAMVNKVPLTINSPYSGSKNLPVYQFTATTLGSGTLYASYDVPITYTSAPTVTTPQRFQLFELSYAQSIASVGDLTSIDFFGIPIEMTTYASGDTTFLRPLAKSTYYSSTLTMLSSLLKLNSNMTLAMLTTTGTPFTPGTSDMSTFARVVGPNQMAAPGSLVIPASNPNYAAGSPFPYPSFADYLDSLVNSNYTFVERDRAVISGYDFDYTGSISGNRTTGYTITLTGTTAAPSPLPSNATLTLTLPPQAGSTGGFDFYIYGAVQSCDSMNVAGFTCIATSTPAVPATSTKPATPAVTATLPTMANSVYGWMQADVMSALNFGYMNGRIDQDYASSSASKTVIGNSAWWYNLPPTPYPFGGARVTNDGYYNPWAAVMYNHSDAYGFAFSDRNGRPSPGVALPTGGTLRLWLLPDARLDAPLLQSSAASCSSTAAASCSVTLTWPAGADVTSYELEVTPPYSATVHRVTQAAGVQPGALTTKLLTGLDPGTNYTITAKAKNSVSSTESTGVPVQVAMPGTPPAPPAGDTAFVFGFNWNVPSYPQLPPLPGPTLQAGNGVLVVATDPSPVQMSFLPNATTANGVSTLTVILPNPTAGPSTLAETFVVSISPQVSALTTPSSSCPGVQLIDGQIVMATGTFIPFAGCSFSVGVHFNQTDVYAAVSSTYRLANFINVPGTGTLIAVGNVGGSELTLTPEIVPPGTSSTLKVLLPNSGAMFNTLSAAYVISAPPGVTFSALSSPPAPPCPGLIVTSSALSLPAGTAIPPGSGCYIGAQVAAPASAAYEFSAPAVATVQMQGPTIIFAGGTYSYNGAGGYNFASGTRPAVNAGTLQSLPLQISIGSTVLWSDVYYLDFVGTSASFTVPLTSMVTPNFLERSAGVLTVNGVPGTPPYSTTPPNQANIGTPFAPIPDKRFWTVTTPAGKEKAKAKVRSGAFVAD